jgi:hypothetical protein
MAPTRVESAHDVINGGEGDKRGELMSLVAILWFVLAFVIGVVAERRGRSGFGWLLAILLSPLIAGILLAVLPDLYMRSLLEEPRRSSAVDDRALDQAIKRGRRESWW